MNRLEEYILILLFLESELSKESKYTEYRQWCVNHSKHYRELIIKAINDDRHNQNT